jgi:hypothetical protein
MLVSARASTRPVVRASVTARAAEATGYGKHVGEVADDVAKDERVDRDRMAGGGERVACDGQGLSLTVCPPEEN